jgi:ankyrin repeat protein
MRNAFGRLNEEFSENAVNIAVELSAAIREDNVDAINKIVFKHFSTLSAAPLLNGAIAPLVKDGDDVRLYPPAILALMFGKRDALRAILKITGNPNLRENPDDPGHSPTLLINAVISGDIEMVKLILEAGADPNEEYITIVDDGQTGISTDALRMAISLNLRKTTSLLLETGAIPSFSAAAVAVVSDDDCSQNLERMIALRPELLNKQFFFAGADTSLLNMAVMSGKLSSVKWLIEQGADFNMAVGGATPFDLAVHVGHDDIAKFLQSVGGVSGTRDGSPAMRNSSASKQEITKIIERLELLEEKFGIAISGLYSTCEYEPYGTPPYHEVKINFDLISVSGGKLERSFNVIASAYNSAGQLMQTDSTRIYADDFMGFSPISITLHLDQSPEKIRLFPAA